MFGNTNGHRVAHNGLDCVFKNAKFVKTKARQSSRDYVNRRCRWRTQNGVVDVYINPTLPYLYANCAAVLTGPLGPFRYRIKDTATGVTQSCLLDVVALTVKEVYGEPISLLLAPALLLAAFDDSVAAKTVMHPSLKKMIVDGFPGPTPDINPAEKVTLLISGDDDRICILNLFTQDGIPSEGTAHTAGGNMKMASGGGGNNE
jgi:hypothetical protein